MYVLKQYQSMWWSGGLVTWGYLGASVHSMRIYFSQHKCSYRGGLQRCVNWIESILDFFLSSERGHSGSSKSTTSSCQSRRLCLHWKWTVAQRSSDLMLFSCQVWCQQVPALQGFASPLQQVNLLQGVSQQSHGCLQLKMIKRMLTAMT